MNYGFSSHHLFPCLSEPPKVNTWQKTVTALHDIPEPDNLLPGIRVAWWIWAFTTTAIIALAWRIKTKRTQASGVSHAHDNSYQSCREELIAFR